MIRRGSGGTRWPRRSRARPGTGDRLGPLLGPPAPSSFGGLVTALINDLAAEEVLLVLDDYHVIGARQVHDSLAFLVEHRPAGICVVLASRSDPPLPLARLRARGQLTEIRAAELRFTPAGAGELLQHAAPALPDASVAALAARTEGWAAGLALAALSLRAGLSVVPLDEVRGWWRYHHLFADLLRARLHQEQPGRLAQLHHNAAAWYAGHDLAEDAIGHAAAAGEMAWAARIIEQHFDLVHRILGEAATIDRWLSVLPDEVVRSRPRLLPAGPMSRSSRRPVSRPASWSMSRP